MSSTGAPARAAASRAGQLTARLRKLAAAGSTGTLPLTGARDGTIHLRTGQVTRAESSRTPGPGTGLAARPLASVPAPADRGQHASSLPDPAMAAALTLLEPAVDAVLDLIVAKASCGRFRPVKGRRPSRLSRCRRSRCSRRSPAASNCCTRWRIPSRWTPA